MEPTQNRSDFHHNFVSLPELVMGLTFGGSKTRFIPNMPIMGVPKLRENLFGASRSTKPAKKVRSQQHRMTCLASLRRQASKKLIPSSLRLLLGPLPAPFLIPNGAKLAPENEKHHGPGAYYFHYSLLANWFTLSSIVSNDPSAYLPHVGH